MLSDCPDDCNLFNKSSVNFTLNELSILIKQDFKVIDREKFIDMIKFEGVNVYGNTIVMKTIIRKMTYIELLYFLKYTTGNVIMPSKFIIKFVNDNLMAHSCFNTIDIPIIYFEENLDLISEIIEANKSGNKYTSAGGYKKKSIYKTNKINKTNKIKKTNKTNKTNKTKK